MRVPEPIRTPALLKEKLQLLEALGDIEIAIKALNQQSDIENPVDRHYEQLDCKINLINRDDQVFGILEAYLHKTHAPTHCTYTMKLIDIFEVEKQHEKENFKDLGNR
jgi:poly [ADP-ribose] polymerase